MPNCRGFLCQNPVVQKKMQLVSTINSVAYKRLSVVSMTVRWESECGVSAQLFDYSTTICQMLCSFMVIHHFKFVCRNRFFFSKLVVNGMELFFTVSRRVKFLLKLLMMITMSSKQEKYSYLTITAISKECFK